MHIGPARSSKHGRKQAVTADPHHRPMSSHRRRLDVGRRAAAAELSNIGAELRTAREQAGLSQRAVAVSLGWRREKISRIENARLRTAALHDLMAQSAALGLTMRVKVYPDGPPLRDIAQLSVSQRLLSRISNTWRVRMEVPLTLPGDRRAFDLWLAADRITIAIEVFTKVRDVQAQIRAAHLKWRDSDATRLIVVVAESHANRTALRAAADLVASDFPISPTGSSGRARRWARPGWECDRGRLGLAAVSGGQRSRGEDHAADCLSELFAREARRQLQALRERVDGEDIPMLTARRTGPVPGGSAA